MSTHRYLIASAALFAVAVLASPVLAQTHGTPPPNEQIERATPTATAAPDLSTETPTPIPTVAVEQSTATPTAVPTATVETPTDTPTPLPLVPEPTPPAWVPDCTPEQPQGTVCGGKG